ncbi:MAG: hypothetical protein KH422_06430, partial [Haemophilus parainfluenzae]|nr:hypothetical protein [Haemophilus parainfluenzae]
SFSSLASLFSVFEGFYKAILRHQALFPEMLLAKNNNSMGNFMKFSHLTDTIILFGDEFDNFQTKLIRVGHNLHLKLGVQVLGCRSN